MSTSRVTVVSYAAMCHGWRPAGVMEATPDWRPEERPDVAVELEQRGEQRGEAVLGDLGGVW